jgi:hypothetical protein
MACAVAEQPGAAEHAPHRHRTELPKKIVDEFRVQARWQWRFPQSQDCRSLRDDRDKRAVTV